MNIVIEYKKIFHFVIFLGNVCSLPLIKISQSKSNLVWLTGHMYAETLALSYLDGNREKKIEILSGFLGKIDVNYYHAVENL